MTKKITWFRSVGFVLLLIGLYGDPYTGSSDKNGNPVPQPPPENSLVSLLIPPDLKVEAKLEELKLESLEINLDLVKNFTDPIINPPKPEPSPPPPPPDPKPDTDPLIG
jgi:hypothetical protein